MKIRKFFLFQLPFIKKPLLVAYFKLVKWTGIILGDRKYLELRYRMIFKEKPDFDNPTTFNEKLNWLKLYNRKPEYSRLVNKYDVKSYVTSICGGGHVVPTYGVWESFDSIDFTTMPNEFVLKPAHSNGHILICKDKSTLDIEKLRKEYSKALKHNLFYLWGEWPYKNSKPQIIAEKLMDNGQDGPIIDYKFMCFNGVPKLMYFTVKDKVIYENFYDMDFNPVYDINHGFIRHQPEFEKPEAIDEMKELAAKLSKDIPFLRVDFYYIQKKVYVGELTFFDWGGMKPFKTQEMDEMLGSWIKLPNLQQTT